MGYQYCSAQPYYRARKLQSRSICSDRWPISSTMGGQCWQHRFPAAVTGISPETVRSKFWRRKGLTTRACTEKSLMRAGTRSWPTPMRTCQFHEAENLFLRRCIISCASQGRTECTLDICRAIPRRTGASGCHKNSRLRSLMPSMSAHR